MENEKKRKKLKKTPKIAITIFSLIFLLAIIYIFSGDITILNDELNVFTDKKINYKATSFFVNRDETVKIEKDLDYNKIGEYEVKLSLKTIFGFRKSFNKIIHVIDKEPPEIKLEGSDKVEVFLNEDYKELGFVAEDNYDKDVNVNIKGEVDTKKTGDYYLTYEAIDSSNNKTELVRKVSVKRESPLKMDLKSFNLDSYFEDVILKETPKMDKSYMDKMIIAGDSVPWHFATDGVYPSNKVWGKPCEGPSNFYTQKMTASGKQTDKTLAELIKENKPEYMTLHMGICDTNRNNPEKFVEDYEKAIDYIKKESPNTKLIIMSLVPQTKEYLSWIPKRNNAIINTHNFYLAELCQKKGVPFLNVANILKNSNGLANQSLYLDDGYHPNSLGMKKIIEYMNTHGYEGE